MRNQMDDLRPEWRGMMLFSLRLIVCPLASGIPSARTHVVLCDRLFSELFRSKAFVQILNKRVTDLDQLADFLLTNSPKQRGIYYKQVLGLVQFSKSLAGTVFHA